MEIDSIKDKDYWGNVSGCSVIKFTDLSDTPSSLQPNKVLKTSTDGTAIELSDLDTSNNIYGVDGSLTSDRTIILNSHQLKFDSTTNKVIINENYTQLYGYNGIKTSNFKVNKDGTIELIAEAGLKINNSFGNIDSILVSKGIDNSPVWEELLVSSDNVNNTEAQTDWDSI